MVHVETNLCRLDLEVQQVVRKIFRIVISVGKGALAYSLIANLWDQSLFGVAGCLLVVAVVFLEEIYQCILRPQEDYLPILLGLQAVHRRLDPLLKDATASSPPDGWRTDQGFLYTYDGFLYHRDGKTTADDRHWAGTVLGARFEFLQHDVRNFERKFPRAVYRLINLVTVRLAWTAAAFITVRSSVNVNALNSVRPWHMLIIAIVSWIASEFSAEYPTEDDLYRKESRERFRAFRKSEIYQTLDAILSKLEASDPDGNADFATMKCKSETLELSLFGRGRSQYTLICNHPASNSHVLAVELSPTSSVENRHARYVFANVYRPNRRWDVELKSLLETFLERDLSPNSKPP
jgi:hypothetical protein